MSAKRDYYEVLGVDKNADKDAIKKAYRKLAIQYHPDRNPGDKAAEEKFKEVQQAYDQIMKEKQQGYSYDSFGDRGQGGYYGGFGEFGGFGGAYGGRQQTNGSSDTDTIELQAAANYIQSGHYREAMNVLQSLSQRNGQWYYLSSMANMGLGNNVNALNDIKQAIRLEPDNVQYQMVLQKM